MEEKIHWKQKGIKYITKFKGMTWTNFDGTKLFLLLFDLYWLRYKKPGDQWYELTDYLRDCLKKDGVKISYDDKFKDVKFETKGVPAPWVKGGGCKGQLPCIGSVRSIVEEQKLDKEKFKDFVKKVKKEANENLQD